MAMLVLDQTASSDMTETLLQRKGMVLALMYRNLHLHAILSLLESYLTLQPRLERREKTRELGTYHIKIILPLTCSQF